MLAQVPGGGTLRTFAVTLAAGAATIKTGLTRWTVLGIVQWHASGTITARTYGVNGTPNTTTDPTAQGMFTGDLVLASSASNTDTVIVTVFGY